MTLGICNPAVIFRFSWEVGRKDRYVYIFHVMFSVPTSNYYFLPLKIICKVPEQSDHCLFEIPLSTMLCSSLLWEENLPSLSSIIKTHSVYRRRKQQRSKTFHPAGSGLSSGSRQFNNFRKTLKLTRFTGPLLPQTDKQRTFSETLSDKPNCMEGVETSQASWKVFWLTELPGKSTL